MLRAAGARWALVIDEGQDVFQFYAKHHEALQTFACSTRKAFRGCSSRAPLAVTTIRLSSASIAAEERFSSRTNKRSSIR